MERLEALRRRIRTIDSALLALVAERMELAREVGAEKQAAGIPLRDYEVEKRVLERAGSAAAELGLAPEMAHDLMRQLIEEACRLQEIGHYSAYSGEAATIAILGGAGRMGRWLTRFLESQGHRVRIVDPEAAPGEGVALGDALAGASLAIVSTPLATVPEAIDAIVASGFRGVVCDIASVKGHLRSAIERARAVGVGVTSIHPMFGPDVRTLSDRVIVVCDCGDQAATERVATLFRETAARLVPLSLARHDEIAGYVLGLSHFANLAFARALARSGLSRAELESVGSTTFRSQMNTTAAVVAENPELYFSIQKLNGFSRRIHSELARAVSEWSDWIEGDDAEAFAVAMRGAHGWIEWRAAD